MYEQYLNRIDDEEEEESNDECGKSAMAQTVIGFAKQNVALEEEEI